MATSQRQLFVEVPTRTNAGKAAAAFRAAGNEADARLMDKIATQPQGHWLGDWSGDVEAAVDRAVAEAGGKIRLLVLYNIPLRDKGAYSAGGVDSSSAYLAWIDGVIRGLGGRRAWVILEPDALAMLDALTPEEQADRTRTMQLAVLRFVGTSARVFIDAGDSNWVPATTMAKRLAAVGVSRAAGIATNVSHYEYLADELVYAAELRRLLGARTRFVVDTGRCGRGPGTTGEWANVATAGLGPAPTLSTGVAGCAGYVWAKPPGESDGPTNGWPDAGTWYLPGALALARNAV